MKKESLRNRLFILVILISLSFTTISCGGDDDDDIIPDQISLFEANKNSLFKMNENFQVDSSTDKKFYLKLTSNLNAPIEMWRTDLSVENDIESWCLQEIVYDSYERIEIIENTSSRFTAKVIFNDNKYEDVKIFLFEKKLKFEVEGHETGYSDYYIKVYLEDTSEQIFGFDPCN